MPADLRPLDPFISHTPGPDCDRFETHTHMADGSIRYGPKPYSHPGEPHNFATTCLRCGEPGTLFVAVLGPTEEARITDRETNHD